MFEYVMSIIIILLAVIGLTSLIRYTALIILSPRIPKNQAFIVILNDRDAEIQLRAAIEQTRWLGKHLCSTILAVDCGLDQNTRDICYRIAQHYDNIIMCKSENIGSYLCCIEPTQS